MNLNTISTWVSKANKWKWSLLMKWFLFLGSFQISVIMIKVMISKIRVWHSLLWYTQKPNGLICCLFCVSFCTRQWKNSLVQDYFGLLIRFCTRECVPQEYKIMTWGEPAPLWYHDKKNLKIHLNHFWIPVMLFHQNWLM
jgi:hypothetical protein